eukprot:scaffold12093_cov137-Isochrysis_galbana.AAC.7
MTRASACASADLSFLIRWASSMIITSAPEVRSPAASQAAAATALASVKLTACLQARGGESSCRKWLWVTMSAPPSCRHRRSCGSTWPDPGLRAVTATPESAPSHRSNSDCHWVCTALGTRMSAVLGRTAWGSLPVWNCT